MILAFDLKDKHAHSRLDPKPQAAAPALVEAILAGGWNVVLKAVRTELPTNRRWRELGICTVALRGQLDPTQIVELTSAIASYNMVARFLVALQTGAES